MCYQHYDIVQSTKYCVFARGRMFQFLRKFHRPRILLTKFYLVRELGVILMKPTILDNLCIHILGYLMNTFRRY